MPSPDIDTFKQLIDIKKLRLAESDLFWRAGGKLVEASIASGKADFSPVEENPGGFPTRLVKAPSVKLVSLSQPEALLCLTQRMPDRASKPEVWRAIGLSLNILDEETGKDFVYASLEDYALVGGALQYHLPTDRLNGTTPIGHGNDVKELEGLLGSDKRLNAAVAEIGQGYDLSGHHS